jgi:hypothetical protein
MLAVKVAHLHLEFFKSKGPTNEIVGPLSMNLVKPLCDILEKIYCWYFGD